MEPWKEDGALPVRAKLGNFQKEEINQMRHQITCSKVTPHVDYPERALVELCFEYLAMWNLVT